LVLIVYWLGNNISLAELLVQMERIPVHAVIITLLLNIAVLGVYGLRLALLLGERQLPSLAIVTIGFGLNGMLPFRLGEVAKLAYARQLFGIQPPRLLAATAIEKLLDLGALAVIGVLASQFIVTPYLRQGTTVVIALVGLLLAALIMAYVVWERRERAGHATHHWISDGFHTLRSQKDRLQVLRLTLATVVIWAVTIASVYSMFNAIFVEASVADALAITLVLALAIAIPSAPAGLGVVEAAIVAYLQQNLNANANQALASALVFHFIVAIPQIIATAAILAGALWRKQTIHRSR